MDASQIIVCSILCMSLMVALSESAPLEHSLTKRHAFEGITQGNNNLFLNFLMKKKIRLPEDALEQLVKHVFY